MNTRHAKLSAYVLRAGAALACVSLSACTGLQSALDPAGPQSLRTSKLWWLFFWVCAAVYVITVAVALVAFYRARQKDVSSETETARDVTEPPLLTPDATTERSMTRVVVGATIVTTVILFVFLVASFSVGRSLSARLENNNKVTIELTGHQWWWEARYWDASAQNIFTTANEIHIPVGEPVTVQLKSQDVIHSFWVPNLTGKKDLIPGKVATLWLRADKPGLYRGQCAEYCGMQHAHMALYVVAEAPEQFNAWLAQQRGASVQPANESQQHGQQVFLHATCVMCHTIQGTIANSHIGPDLTHVGSRLSIAAGTLQNTRDHLANWVVDSQTIKPGNRMPPNNLPANDLQALLDYLQSLK
jgi:cytochrome c oxidase subunit II